MTVGEASELSQVVLLVQRVLDLELGGLTHLVAVDMAYGLIELLLDSRIPLASDPVDIRRKLGLQFFYSLSVDAVGKVRMEGRE